MAQREVETVVRMPLNAWQCLVAMAADDLREPGEFLRWLTHQEAKRRGLLQGERDSGAPELPSAPEPAHV
jgi:hypothetical protein